MFLAFMVVSLVLLLIAALNVPTGNVSIGWLGVFFFVLAQVWGKF